MIIFGGPLVFLVLLVFVMRAEAHRFGWAAVILCTLSVPFWASGIMLGIFSAEVGILAIPLLAIAVLLTGTGCTLGHNFLPRRAERIAEREQERARWQWAADKVRATPASPDEARRRKEWTAYAQREAAREAKWQAELRTYRLRS